MQAKISANSPAAAAAIEGDMNAFKEETPLPYSYASKSGRKVSAAADAKRMIDTLLQNAVDNSAATSVKLADFSRVAGTNDFKIDIILVYPESSTAADMDTDAANTENVSKALKDAIENDVTFKDLMDTATISTKQVFEIKFTVPAAAATDRDASLKIETNANQTEPFQSALDAASTDPDDETLNAVSKLIGDIRNISKAVLNATSISFVYSIRDNNTHTILTRMAFPANLTGDQIDTYALQFISDVSEAMQEQARRRLLANKAFVDACDGNISGCVFEGASYIGFDPVTDSFVTDPNAPTNAPPPPLVTGDGAAGMRALVSGLLVSVAAAFMLLV